MLLNLREYHRPQGGTTAEQQRKGLDEALTLLARADVRTQLLAGGDTLVGEGDPSIEAVVDIQDLGLDALQATPTLHIGATVTRSRLATWEATGALYGDLIAEAASHWGGSVQRNRATVGGAVMVAAANDPLLAALLVCDAQVRLYSHNGEEMLPLRDFLPRRSEFASRPSIITALEVPQPAAQTGTALAIVARTPADAPIVLAAALIEMSGQAAGRVRLALGGVADSPLSMSGVEQSLAGQAISPELLAEVAEQIMAPLHPTADFRGSSDYRRHMAGVLAQRALQQAWGRAQ